MTEPSYNEILTPDLSSTSSSFEDLSLPNSDFLINLKSPSGSVDSFNSPGVTYHHQVLGLNQASYAQPIYSVSTNSSCNLTTNNSSSYKSSINTSPLINNGPQQSFSNQKVSNSYDVVSTVSLSSLLAPVFVSTTSRNDPKPEFPSLSPKPAAPTLPLISSLLSSVGTQKEKLSTLSPECKSESQRSPNVIQSSLLKETSTDDNISRVEHSVNTVIILTQKKLESTETKIEPHNSPKKPTTLKRKKAALKTDKNIASESGSSKNKKQNTSNYSTIKLVDISKSQEPPETVNKSSVTGKEAKKPLTTEIVVVPQISLSAQSKQANLKTENNKKEFSQLVHGHKTESNACAKMDLDILSQNRTFMLKDHGIMNNNNRVYSVCDLDPNLMKMDGVTGDEFDHMQEEEGGVVDDDDCLDGVIDLPFQDSNYKTYTTLQVTPPSVDTSANSSTISPSLSISSSFLSPPLPSLPIPVVQTEHVNNNQLHLQHHHHLQFTTQQIQIPQCSATSASLSSLSSSSSAPNSASSSLSSQYTTVGLLTASSQLLSPTVSSSSTVKSADYQQSRNNSNINNNNSYNNNPHQLPVATYTYISAYQKSPPITNNNSNNQNQHHHTAVNHATIQHSTPSATSTTRIPVGNQMPVNTYHPQQQSSISTVGYAGDDSAGDSVAPVYDPPDVGSLPSIQALPIGQIAMQNTAKHYIANQQNQIFAQLKPIDNEQVQQANGLDRNPKQNSVNQDNNHNPLGPSSIVTLTVKKENCEGSNATTGNILPVITELMPPKVDIQHFDTQSYNIGSNRPQIVIKPNFDQNQCNYHHHQVMSPLSSLASSSSTTSSVTSSVTSLSMTPLSSESSSSLSSTTFDSGQVMQGSVPEYKFIELDTKISPQISPTSSSEGSSCTSSSTPNGFPGQQGAGDCDKRYQALDRIETSIKLVLNNSNNNLKKMSEKKDCSKRSNSSEPTHFDAMNPDCNIHLWEFLLELLLRGDHRDKICWTGVDYEFILKTPDQVAKLWGVRKAKPKMNYEKLARGLRYYYSKKILAKSSGRRYVYKFLCDISKSKVAKGKDEAVALVKSTHTFSANFKETDL